MGPLALLDLLKQASLGLLAGLILGYLAATLIAHEKYGFLQEYAPVVSLMAVIGAYLGADGLRHLGRPTAWRYGYRPRFARRRRLRLG